MRASGAGPLAATGAGGADTVQVSDELPAVGERSEGGVGEPFDDRDRIAATVCAQRGEVGIDVGQQPRGDRDGHVSGEAGVAQLGVDERPPVQRAKSSMPSRPLMSQP